MDLQACTGVDGHNMKRESAPTLVAFHTLLYIVVRRESLYQPRRKHFEDRVYLFCAHQCR